MVVRLDHAVDAPQRFEGPLSPEVTFMKPIPIHSCGRRPRAQGTMRGAESGLRFSGPDASPARKGQPDLLRISKADARFSGAACRRPALATPFALSDEVQRVFKDRVADAGRTKARPNRHAATAVMLGMGLDERRSATKRRSRLRLFASFTR